MLHLSGLEKVEGVHGDLRAPLSAVKGAEVVDDAHGAVGFGIKAGTRIFGVVEVGTVRGVGRKVFAAVHHDTPRGVRVRLEGADHDEWIVGCVDPKRCSPSSRCEANRVGGTTMASQPERGSDDPDGGS